MGSGAVAVVVGLAVFGSYLGLLRVPHPQRLRRPGGLPARPRSGRSVISSSGLPLDASRRDRRDDGAAGERR